MSEWSGSLILNTCRMRIYGHVVISHGADSE